VNKQIAFELSLGTVLEVCMKQDQSGQSGLYVRIEQCCLLCRFSADGPERKTAERS